MPATTIFKYIYIYIYSIYNDNRNGGVAMMGTGINDSVVCTRFLLSVLRFGVILQSKYNV